MALRILSRIFLKSGRNILLISPEYVIIQFEGDFPPIMKGDLVLMKTRKILSILLALLLALALIPATAVMTHAATGLATIDVTSIAANNSGAPLESQWTYASNTLTLSEPGGNYKLTGGTNASLRVTVSGLDAIVTLDGVSISGFTASADFAFELSGANTMVSGTMNGRTLTIGGSGTLAITNSGATAITGNATSVLKILDSAAVTITGNVILSGVSSTNRKAFIGDNAKLTAVSTGGGNDSWDLTAADGTTTHMWKITNQYGADENADTTITARFSSGDTTIVERIPIPAAPPIIKTSNLPSGVVGTAYSQTLSVISADPVTWSIDTGSLPAGLTLNTATGAITGTPTTAGPVNFTVMAANGTLPNTTRALQIMVNPAPVPPAITTTSLDGGVVGTAYSVTLEATGTAPITWNIASGNLPAGLNLNTTTGAITGTPTTVETASFTIKASNGVAPDATQALSIAVIAAPVAPAITTTSLPAGTVGAAYSQTLQATGTTPITWSATGLPTGLSISAAGVISGTPTAAGTFSVVITANNGVSPNGTKTLSLAVAAAPAAPAITTTSLPAGTVGAAYSQTLQATGTAPITWSATGLPAGLTISAAGVISGTPTAVGTSSVVITANNGVSPNGTKTLSLVINPAKGIFGTNAKWFGAWWHYLLFFFCFGFIWMWF